MFSMSTKEGNVLVGRILDTGVKLKQEEQVEWVWDWVLIQLEKLSHAEGFEEATDRAVRDAAFNKLIYPPHSTIPDIGQ